MPNLICSDNISRDGMPKLPPRELGWGAVLHFLRRVFSGLVSSGGNSSNRNTTARAAGCSRSATRTTGCSGTTDRGHPSAYGQRGLAYLGLAQY